MGGERGKDTSKMGKKRVRDSKTQNQFTGAEISRPIQKYRAKKVNQKKKERGRGAKKGFRLPIGDRAEKG